MNILEKLKAIVQYYDSTRRVGHTKLMLDGVSNTEKYMVITQSDACGIDLQKRAQKKIFTTSINSPNLLRGANLPITFDNDVLQLLFAQAIEAIESCVDEETIKKSNKLLDEASNKIEELKAENDSLTNRLVAIQAILGV